MTSGYLNGVKVKMVSNGYWLGDRGARITSYIKAGTDNGAEADGKVRQYSMSRHNGHNTFYLETED